MFITIEEHALACDSPKVIFCLRTICQHVCQSTINFVKLNQNFILLIFTEICHTISPYFCSLKATNLKVGKDQATLTVKEEEGGANDEREACFGE